MRKPSIAILLITTAAAATAQAAPSPYGAKLAAAVHRHLPATSGLGRGEASCSFHVNADGSTANVNCKGKSAGQVAVLKRAIVATKAPPPPGGSFSASQSVRFH